MPEPDYDVSAWPTWLIELVDWLESRRVERVRTTETYAWHYRGRQVFAVRPAAAGTYTLTAGASFTESETDRTPTLTLRVANASPPTDAELEGIKDAVDTAIERRRTAQDQGHREHLLQAAIGTDPSLIGMSHLRRELPARRPKLPPRRGRGAGSPLADPSTKWRSRRGLCDAARQVTGKRHEPPQPWRRSTRTRVPPRAPGS
jgi:hypothetical protein